MPRRHRSHSAQARKGHPLHRHPCARHRGPCLAVTTVTPVQIIRHPPARHKRRGMDPRVCAAAPRLLRPRMTSWRRAAANRQSLRPHHVVILGLDPRIHASPSKIGGLARSCCRTLTKFQLPKLRQCKTNAQILNMALYVQAGYSKIMVAPDFSKSAIDILARRARFQCSNPDCGVHTVGPNSDPAKATTIGEAAHIMGAQPGAVRYDATMSDVTRAAITNAIWLCRNCHGQIDRDAAKYPVDLLFAWRKDHEDRVARELGTRGDRIRYETEMASLDFLSHYPPIIQRIVIDKPDGWEWRFVAELMRHLNKPQLKRLKNLQAGHYYRPQPRIQRDQFLNWVVERTHIMSNLIGPLAALIDRLTASWGEPGEPGDIEEMHDVCVLIRDALAAIVDFEESMHFAHIPDEGEALRTILTNAIGRNAAKLAEIPEKLDEMVAMIDTDHGGTVEEPLIVRWTVDFSLPDEFNDRFDKALIEYEHINSNYL
jgi:hypothetical protein